MNNTITLTDEQMKALQSGQSITIEPPKQSITKWEPKGGDYKVKYDLTGPTLDTSIMISELQSGLRYNNKSQAEQAARALRSYARQLAWLAENDDGWVADWSDAYQGKYQIYILNIMEIKLIHTETL